MEWKLIFSINTKMEKLVAWDGKVWHDCERKQWRGGRVSKGRESVWERAWEWRERERVSTHDPTRWVKLGNEATDEGGEKKKEWSFQTNEQTKRKTSCRVLQIFFVTMFISVLWFLFALSLFLMGGNNSNSNNNCNSKQGILKQAEVSISDSNGLSSNGLARQRHQDQQP